MTLLTGDCLAVLPTLPDASVDAIVTDPPYGLRFMGKAWDYDVPRAEVWRACLRVLKPGGHLLAFAGMRTQHRMAVAIEDAGFEIRDLLAWAYGSGFPKSLDVSKAIDKTDAGDAQLRRRLRFTAWVRSTGVTARQIDEATGTNMGGHYTTAASQPAIMTREHLEACRHLFAKVPSWVEDECDVRSVESQNMADREVVAERTMTQGGGASLQIRMGERREVKANVTAPATDAARQWAGWGTALKPALEPITLARKPLDGTVAETVLRHGTGAINVDVCRVAVSGGRPLRESRRDDARNAYGNGLNGSRCAGVTTSGRWPANLLHDGSDEATAPLGAAARFFYSAKASRADRDAGLEGFAVRSGAETVERAEDSAGLQSPRAGAGRTSGGRNHHPTVKPTDLMRYLVRLVTPPGGVVLDPFMGSGSTGKAAVLEGARFVGIERDPDYAAIAAARIAWAEAEVARAPAQPGLFDCT